MPSIAGEYTDSPLRSLQSIAIGAGHRPIAQYVANLFAGPQGDAIQQATATRR
jgi:hypothetical protein